MSILNKLLGSAQRKAPQGKTRGGTYGRTARRPARTTGTNRGAGLGRGMAKRPAPRRSAYGRQQPSTAAGGLGGLINGLLRRR